MGFMSLLPTEEQTELQNSLRGFFSERCTSAYLRSRIEGPAASDPSLWKGLEELGLISYFASQDSESRPTARELGIIAHEAGRALLPEPLISAIFAGPFFYFQLLDAAERKQIEGEFDPKISSQIESGTKRATLSASSIFQPSALEFRGTDALARVSGKVAFVPSGLQAGYLLFAAVRSGIETLFFADLKTGKEQRVIETPITSLDLTQKYFDLELQNVAAVPLSTQALQLVRRALSAALAEELAGVSARAVEMTVEHVKTRKQFGTAIGSFQAVQHRLADMHLQAEAMRNLATFASWVAQQDDNNSKLSCFSALDFACDQAPQIVEGAIQMHGGIGFTWEYDLHLFLRRAKMLEMLYGNDPKRTADIIAAV